MEWRADGCLPGIAAVLGRARAGGSRECRFVAKKVIAPWRTCPGSGRFGFFSGKGLGKAGRVPMVTPFPVWWDTQVANEGRL